MAVTNVISVLQERFGSQTWSGRPSVLWFAEAWPRVNGQWVSLPLLRFEHDGTPHNPLFKQQVLQHWRFTLFAYADSPQGVEALYNGVMFDGQDPSSGLGYGFWKPSEVTVPSGYLFKHLVPTDPFKIKSQVGNFAPSGTPLCVGTWGMELFVHRTSFA